MLCSLLLMGLLAQVLLPLGVAPAPAPPRHGAASAAAAERAAAEGREEAALAEFQRLAATNPDDHAARLWIAHLHERMGHPGRAEVVYHSVLLEDPGSLDARLGLARTLLARDNAREAIRVLEPGEAIAHDDDRLLATLGIAHGRAGRSDIAISYLERAVAAAPAAGHRRLLEQARRSYLHRIETRGFSEDFSGITPATGSGELLVDLRLAESLRVIGRAQVQRKFRVREERGGAGVEWRWTAASVLRGQALVGSGNVVMPEGDYLGAIDYAYRRAVWTASVRYFDFTGAWVSVFSPAVEWAASDRFTLGLAYALSITESNALPDRVDGHTLRGDAGYTLSPRVRLLAGYARGVDDFENFSIDRIGDFRAHTAAAGVRIDFPTLTSLLGRYEHQWRPGGTEMGRVTVSVAQRF